MSTTFIGQQIAACRRARGWSQQTLADRVGVSRSLIGHIETGTRPLDDRNLLYRLAETLGATIPQLTGEPYDHGDPVLDTVRLAVPDLERAIMAGGADAVGDPPPLDRLVEEAEAALRLRMDTDYARLSRTLPGLITGLYQHAGTSDRDERRRAAWLALAKADVCAAMVAKTLGMFSLAWLAVEDGTRAAARAEDPVAQGAADFARAQVLLSAGVTGGSRQYVQGSIERLGGALSDRDGRQILGILHLHAALVNAALGDGDDARAHYAEARQLAEHTGEGDAWALMFGPSNVAVWAVGIALEERDGGKAQALAAKVDRSAIPTADRHARFLIDAGRGAALARRWEDTLSLLLQAERIAPAYVRSRPVARELAGYMLRESQRRLAAGPLGQFAARVGATP
jgi:transcriptional regulator with XRE-family HTH domain